MSATVPPPPPVKPTPPPTGVTPLLGEAASYVQAPRFQILLNGWAAYNPLSADVTVNNYAEPARFSLVIVVDPAAAAYYESQVSIAAEVQVSLNGGSYQTLIYGLVDTIEYDPIEGVLMMAGRDLAGQLMDTPTENSEQNLTASQVVEMFVQQHASQGLLGNITATKPLVGTFYGVDYSFSIYGGNLYRPTNQWDMILFLAQMSGFEAYITGRTLYFGPSTPDTAAPFVIAVNPGPPVAANVEKLRLTRSLTLAKDVQVTVISWQSLLMRPVKRVVRSSQKGAPAGGYGPTQNYVFNKPDLTPDQALKYAQAKLADITRRERVVEFEMPGELTLTPSSRVLIEGTNTDWDQLYYIDQIERSLSFDDFKQSVRLKNISPANQTIVF